MLTPSNLTNAIFTTHKINHKTKPNLLLFVAVFIFLNFSLVPSIAPVKILTICKCAKMVPLFASPNGNIVCAMQFSYARILCNTFIHFERFIRRDGLCRRLYSPECILKYICKKIPVINCQFVKRINNKIAYKLISFTMVH